MLQSRIVPSKPALILEGEKKNLIITDIHIGFENSMASNEIFIGKTLPLMKPYQRFLKLSIQRVQIL